MMRMITTALATIAAVSLVAAGCSQPEQARPSSLSQKTFRIVGGQAETGFAAVGALVENGEAFCTGTLVTTTTVITAAHCVPGKTNPASIGFFVGPDSTKPGSGTTLKVASIHPHPNYDPDAVTNDIAVIKLAEPAAVTPIGALTEPMDASWKGKMATFVGYGVTGASKSDAGKKRSVTIALSSVDATTIRYEDPKKNTCFGDSGGPALAKVGSEFKLVGVTSWGDNECAKFGVNTRVDTYLDFIKGVDANAGNATSPSGAKEQGSDDVCALNGWYGDGICDMSCAKPDSDCEGLDMDDAPDPSEDADYCEENGWYSDGICDVGCPKEDTEDCEGLDLESSGEEAPGELFPEDSASEGNDDEGYGDDGYGDDWQDDDGYEGDWD